MSSHKSDKQCSYCHIHKEHDLEEIHERVLVCIQEPEAIDELNLTLDEKMGLVSID